MAYFLLKQVTSCHLSHSDIEITLDELLMTNPLFENLPTLLSTQFVRKGESVQRANQICSPEMLLKVHSSATTTPTEEYPWLGTFVVSSDKRGANATTRLDNVLLRKSTSDLPLFGKLLRFISTAHHIGNHQFGVVQLYQFSSEDSIFSAPFGELYLQLSSDVILYV